MSGASLVAMGIALVALFGAAFNAWLYWLRRQERGHLWLSLAAVGALACTIPAGFLYASTSAEEARNLRHCILLGGLPLLMGFSRFTESFLGVDLRRFERGWSIYLVVFFLVGIIVQWNVGAPIEREIAWLGTDYVDVEIPAWFALGSGGFAVLAGQLSWLYWKHLPEDMPSRPGIYGAVALWILAMANDLAVGAGALDGVFLLGLGYDGFVLAFTAVLVNRFALAMEQVETNAGTLQRASQLRAQELRQRDIQLAHGERMATVGTLAAGLAHEVNNPIAFVSSNLQQLRHLRKDPSAAADVESLFEETREGIERVRTIVQGLLRLARKSEERLEPLELREVVEQILPVLRHELERRATVVTELETTKTVLGDARLLGQVVLNLLLNAMQAIPDDREGRIEIRTFTRDGGSTLEIRDDGRGLSTDVAEHAFEPFFTTRESGTGLGLVVSRRIIDSHGGRISLASSGRRTTASVWLPAAELEPAVDVEPDYSNSRSDQNG